MTDVSKWNDFALHQVGRHWIKCSSLNELKETIQYYGLPLSLSQFNIDDLDKEAGYIKNHYQNWNAIAYKP